MTNHLCEATTVFLHSKNISDDHPALEMLHDLETTTYYNLPVKLEQCITQAILRWADYYIKYSDVQVTLTWGQKGHVRKVSPSQLTLTKVTIKVRPILEWSWWTG